MIGIQNFNNDTLCIGDLYFVFFITFLDLNQNLDVLIRKVCPAEIKFNIIGPLGQQALTCVMIYHSICKNI